MEKVIDKEQRNMTPDEENILSSIENYRATLEEIIVFGHCSKKKSFDPCNRETWPGLYRGLDAAFNDCLNRVKSAIRENQKTRITMKNDKFTWHTLSGLELVEVLSDTKQKDSLFIAVAICKEKNLVHLQLANGSFIEIPFSIFKPSGTTSPNFDSPAVIDHGLTLKLGDYEASNYSILQEINGK